jgi:hypothetical protein
MQTTTAPLDRRLRALGAWCLALGLVAGCADAVVTEAPITPAPTIDAARAAAALEKFKELRTSPTLTMHLEQTTSYSGALASQGFYVAENYRMDVSGQNFAATIFSANSTIEFRNFGGIAYLKIGNGPWGAGELDPAIAGEIANPWKSLGPLEKLVPFTRTVNPREAFIFGITEKFEYQSEYMKAQGIVGHITAVRFTVRFDGIPIEALVNGEATVNGAKVTWATTLKATRVGDQDILVEPPA